MFIFISSTFSEKENSATESEKEIKKSVKTEEKFKERSTPKITFRSALGAGNEIAFKKRKLNPDKKRNVRQTNPNKTEWREEWEPTSFPETCPPAEKPWERVWLRGSRQFNYATFFGATGTLQTYQRYVKFLWLSYRYRAGLVPSDSGHLWEHMGKVHMLPRGLKLKMVVASFRLMRP